MKKLTITMIIIDILVAICFIVVYLVDGFKYPVIATLLGTKNHQWIANTFYSDETIAYVRAADSYIPIDEDTNLDAITIDSSVKTDFDNKFEEQILTRDAGNDLYKVIDVKVAGKYAAKMLVLYDPTKLTLMTSRAFNSNNTGQQSLGAIAKRYGAIAGINGGGFVDNGYGSDIPTGYVIKDSKIIWSTTNTKRNIIGLTKEGKLLLVNATGEEAIESGVVDGLEFGPFLIVNGKALQYTNEAITGYARAARSVIAQRKDGVILLLVSVGNGSYWNQPSLGELISILKDYGAYNAANLDGGFSATMYVNGSIINHPCDATGTYQPLGRLLVTAWGIIP